MEGAMYSMNLKLAVIVAATLGMLLVAPNWIGAWQRPTPQPKASPNAPTNQNVPQGLDGRPLTGEEKKQALDTQNQQEIRMDVQRLYAMATELKDEVDRTNTNNVLSATVLKRAQDIEKLAKQIKDRAKH
jgi:hypothetical protein